MADRKGSASLRNGTTDRPLTPTAATVSAATAAALQPGRSTSPYGTRSRNRGARVNYAEDKDNEMDYEYTEPAAGSSSVSSTANSAGAAGVTSTTNTTNSAVATKEKEMPGNGNVVAGKKRKGMGGSQPVVMRELGKEPAFSNMLSFENPHLVEGKLVSDDGTVLEQHDHIYLICEPPGEPYYLGRIMEFLHANNDSLQPIDAIRVNWYYRPKDIQRKVTDTRVVFASMHSDTCPLNAIRGKCYIRHREEIENLDAFRKNPDCFYFERMFDRYIHRYYDVIPTTKVKNVPEHIRKVLCERWKYLLVEPQRAKELCSQMKECKRCTGYCANNESVHCAVCGETYHMNCVRPPLLKKPSRGFAWACGPCNQAQERKLEARNTPTLAAGGGEVDEDIIDEDDEDMAPALVPQPNGTETPSEAAVEILKQQLPTKEQVQFANMWQMRYLGMHCRIEDALDYDDRIYPRAASRIGPRHQAVVPAWHGRPVEYVKPIEVKKKHSKNAAKIAKQEAEAREKRPPWVMDEPVGYIERGQDDGSTSTLQFMIPVAESNVRGGEPERGFEDQVEILDDYMESTKKVAESLKMDFFATNFMDKSAELLFKNDWQPKKALEQLAKVNAVKDLKEPRLKPDEVKRFEEGVARYGSELHLVTKHVKTRKEADIVRYYYQWKKTPKGREIWGNFDGRKEKKEAKTKKPVAKLVDDVADEEDDSAFDVEKAGQRKRGFECKFCGTRKSRQWRRAPGVAPGTLISTEKPGSHKKKQEEKWLVSALCRKCAELWRRYAIQWEDPEEVAKKMGQGGNRAWKRRSDEELLRELTAAQEVANAEAAMAATSGASVTPQPSSFSGTATPDTQKEPPKKKHKGEANGVAKKSKDKAAEKAVAEKQKEKEKSKEPPPPPPEPPKPRRAPCGVCSVVEEIGKKHVVCRECKMTVHRRCYGISEIRNPNKWSCEMCANDKNPVVSTNYECVLCPHVADPDAEPEKNNPYHKSSYKKKAAEKAAKESPELDGRKVKDVDKHRPQQPREPLKKTAHNNWAHVICSVFTPETKFSDPASMKVVEGVASIPRARWLQECHLCHVGGGSSGACVQCSCPTCHLFVHVGCANQAGWALGFDITPVKGSRRDTVSIVKIGTETGHMIAGVWCPDHRVSTMHPMNETVDESTGETALELYIRTYKQADLTLTNTVRKATQLSVPKQSQSHRRNSLVGANAKEGYDSVATVLIKSEGPEDKVGGLEGLVPEHVGGEGEKQCIQCGVRVSPLWWKLAGPARPVANGNLPSTPTPIANGTYTPRTLGLVCHRCHCKENEPVRRMSPQVNGDAQSVQSVQSKYTALPPLHLFLAEQHAILTKRPPTTILPPPSSIPQAPINGPVPITQQPLGPMGSQVSHQQSSIPAPQQAALPAALPPPPAHAHPSHIPTNGHQHPVLPHHNHTASIPPPHTASHSVQQHHAPQHPHPQHHTVLPPHQPHQAQLNHHPLSHPPPITHMSPRIPSIPQMSPRTPYTPPPGPQHPGPQHMSPRPPQHNVQIPSPIRQNHILNPMPQMNMHRPYPQMAPTASMSVGQPGPIRREDEEERRRREEDERRRREGRLSGASGSPALANLLS